MSVKTVKKTFMCFGTVYIYGGRSAKKKLLRAKNEETTSLGEEASDLDPITVGKC